jgi:hypothetical protein
MTHVKEIVTKQKVHNVTFNWKFPFSLNGIRECTFVIQ